MKKQQTYYVIFASFVVMLIMAITESARGILVPTFKDEFGVSNTQMGNFILLTSLAYVIATYFAAKLVKANGQKKTILLGMFVSASGFFATSFVNNFALLIVGYFVLTIGISFILMSLNTIIPLLKITYFGVVMNMLHFFYGLGATLTQRITGYLITYGISWRLIFIVFSLLYLIGIILFFFVEQPPRKEAHHVHLKIESYEWPLVIMLSISLGFYVASEIQTSNWLVNYLKELYSFTSDKGSFYLSFFFGSLAVGRLLGGYVLEKIGYLKGLIISLALAFILYCIGLTNENTLIVLSISGLFFSIVYPTTILVLQHFFEDKVSEVIAIVTMSASFISMVFGWLIGFLNDQIGVRISYFIIPGSILISLLFMIGVAKEIKKVTAIRLELNQ